MYSLGGELRPGSVRDAVWRAGKLVSELAALGRLGMGKRVIIIGSGVSALSAAIHAMACKTEVFIIRNRLVGKSPFEECAIREICPNTFDFPGHHWNQQFFPVSGVNMEYPCHVRLETGIADGVYSSVYSQYESFCSSFPTLIDVANDATTSEVVSERHLVRVEYSDAGGQKTRRSDVLILATGIGTLTRKVFDDSDPPLASEFEGFHYFDNDPVLAESLNGNGARKRILLIGGGDGSLVDFVRLLTHQLSPQRALTRVPLSKGELNQLRNLSIKTWKRLEKYGARELHRELVTHQQELKPVLDGIWSRSKVADAIHAMMIPPDRDRPVVQIACDCFHFGISYLATRVMAELIARCLAEDITRENGDIRPFRFTIRANRVNRVGGGKCGGLQDRKDGCPTHPHNVTFRKVFCSGQVPAQCEASLRDNSCFPDNLLVVNSADGDHFDQVMMRVGTDYLAGLPLDLKMEIRARGQIWDVPAMYRCRSKA
ncbi:hypothetical protein AYO47_01805 [Planctomyces sp. SCGC AG-212-M04]|nr:hypothetical protein AYO47_01805 [Planctomyces sp. SCGC AG-212-M04]